MDVIVGDASHLLELKESQLRVIVEQKKDECLAKVSNKNMRSS